MAYSKIEHGAPFTLQELYPYSPFFKETVSLRVTGMLRGYSIETAIGVIEDGGRSLKINTQHLRDVFNMQLPSRSRLELFETQALPTKEEFDVSKNASRFDIVEDFTDHHFASRGTTSKQHSKDWAKRIQEEWRILEHDLQEMIFVRAYESRMYLLRAVIIGADGTPYHDGLFFFDIFFPDTYPSVPPTVHYQSGGLRINPNLYNCGKVCMSLLGTWSGSQREKCILS